jgi:hypothetical protein
VKGESFSIEIKGLDKILKRMKKIERAIPDEIDTTTEDFAHLTLSHIQRNLSGRPGMPTPDTRQYLNSWRAVKLADGRWGVTSDAPQVNRLEHGFVGVDSLGRHYMQYPLPHIAPAKEAALKEARPLYIKAIRRLKKL